MISIVLVQPSTGGNLGAVARVMANFELKNLFLIKPKCKKDSSEAEKRAMHGLSVLKKAKIIEWNYLKKFDYLIATTSKLGTDYNIPRSPISPEQLAKKINTKNKIAILFGPEDKGLTNEQIQKCDFTVTIPTSRSYPVLNLSHSVAIILYELFKNKPNVSSHIIFASKKEKQQLMKLVNQNLNKMHFATESKKQTQKTVWKKMIGKSFLTKRESYALMGFLKKLQ